MSASLLSGSAHRALGQAVASAAGTALVETAIERFPDGEIHIEIGRSVRGEDLYLLQPTGPPVDANLMELLLLADACRRAGARRMTAVIPYFGYARQDRRVHGREAVGARLVADLLVAGGLDRIVGVDLHGSSVEGLFAVPLEHLTAVPLLVEALRPFAGERSMIVAPDLGAAKLADRVAKRLGLPLAVVHKSRRSGELVTAHAVTGDVRGRRPLVVDDMISTGGTIEAAAKALLAAGALPEITVAATHGLLVGPAVERLRKLSLRRLIITDSVPSAPSVAPLPIEVVSIAPLLAAAIDRLHHEKSLGDLLVTAHAG